MSDAAIRFSRAAHLKFSRALLYGHEFVGCLVALGLRDDQTQLELRKLAAEYVAEAEDIESNESGGQHARQMKEVATEAALLLCFA